MIETYIKSSIADYFTSISFKGDDNQVVIESTGKERIGKFNLVSILINLNQISVIQNGLYESTILQLQFFYCKKFAIHGEITELYPFLPYFIL